MISNTNTTFGAWALSKASTRAGRLLQEFQTNGLLSLPERNPESIEKENAKKKVTFVNLTVDPFPFKSYLRRIVYSSYFSNFMLLVIILNCITIALEVSLPADQAVFSPYFDNFYLSVYTIEFLWKFAVDHWQYFKSGYNVFDFLILLLSIVQYLLQFLDLNLSRFTFLRVFRSLRALRSLRSVGSIRKLQVIVNALLKTLRKNVLDILACLFIFMFLFAIMGYYLFGTGENGLPQYFGSLPQGLLTLMSYITSCNWSNVQYALQEAGFIGSEAYTIIFMFIGCFVFPNLFIGVICENIDDATATDRAIQHAKKMAIQKEKKEAFKLKQKKDMAKLLQRSDVNSSADMQKVLESLAGTLRHDEVVPMTHLACNLTWFETFMVTQYHLENSMYRCQQTHFNIANTLAEVLDRRMKTMLDNS